MSGLCERWSIQGSVLSSLLSIIVMEAVTHSVREGQPWEMLYTDDLVLVGKCEEELKEKLRKWNECLKDKGLQINEDKTKVMCESFGRMQKLKIAITF